MLRAGFELMVPIFKRVKISQTSDRGSTLCIPNQILLPFSNQQSYEGYTYNTNGKDKNELILFANPEENRTCETDFLSKGEGDKYILYFPYLSYHNILYKVIYIL
jgi:hypothetical protein